MRQSQLFTHTRREAPKDEAAKNAKLLIRAGFIHKEMAGVYDFLPLGLRTLNKIIQIIREEMDAIGGQEVLLSALQEPGKWQASGRWSDEAMAIWFKTRLDRESELGLANTHEEPMTAMLAAQVQSYQDLPRAVYQFQTKFRNEPRAKSGLLRTREFLMKDLYSFGRSQAELDEFYETVSAAYTRIFKRVGLGERTHLTFASGGVFSKYSHEFQTLCEAGEDTIYLSAERGLAINLEVCTPEVLADLALVKDELVPHKAIEVGNIFKLGTRFSEALGLRFRDERGETRPVVMGSYGIGPARVMATIAEILADENGLVWPASVAPFAVQLVSLFDPGGKVAAASERFSREWQAAGVSVLWDDRPAAAGEKFADADLLGLPFRVVVSEKTLSQDKVEFRPRRGGAAELIDPTALAARLADYV